MLGNNAKHKGDVEDVKAKICIFSISMDTLKMLKMPKFLEDIQEGVHRRARSGKTLTSLTSPLF